MWILITIVVLVVLGVAYVAVRQARHPVAPGRRLDGDAQAQQDGAYRGHASGNP